MEGEEGEGREIRRERREGEIEGEEGRGERWREKKERRKGGEMSWRCLPSAPGCKKDKGGIEDKGSKGVGGRGRGRGEREGKGGVEVVTFSSRMYLGTL